MHQLNKVQVCEKFRGSLRIKKIKFAHLSPTLEPSDENINLLERSSAHQSTQTPLRRLRGVSSHGMPHSCSCSCSCSHTPAPVGPNAWHGPRRRWSRWERPEKRTRKTAAENGVLVCWSRRPRNEGKARENLCRCCCPRQSTTAIRNCASSARCAASSAHASGCNETFLRWLRTVLKKKKRKWKNIKVKPGIYVLIELSNFDTFSSKPAEFKKIEFFFPLHHIQSTRHPKKPRLATTSITDMAMVHT